MDKVIIELSHIKKIYELGGSQVRALDDVSLQIKQGEFVAIMGSSGSGKSTLLHVLGLLDRPDEGQYLLQGQNVAQLSDDALAGVRGRVAGFVFQQFHLLSRITALQNVELPLIYSGEHALKERAVEKMNAVGLADRKEHRPNQISGGQQQRVAIARALVNEPMILFADEPTGNLDTASEAEIMDILKALNKEGKTIVMVTHEQEVAAHAKRIIKMRDGKIVSDECSDESVFQTDVLMTQSDGLSVEDARSGWKGFGLEEVTECFRQGWQSISSNKVRSFLSMLGILIGVGSVIAMLALGRGAEMSLESSMAALGTNIVSVSPGATQVGGVSMQAGSVTRMSLKDAQAIENVPEVQGVAPIVSSRFQIVYQNKNWNTQIYGTSVDYESVKSATPVVGRFFTEQDDLKREKVALIGLTVAEELFASNDPIGKIVKINKINFRVIGVLPEKGSAGRGGDQDDVVLIPISTAMFRLMGKDYVDSIEVQAVSAEAVDGVMAGIRKTLNERHKLDLEDDDSFKIRNMADMQQALTSMTKTMTMLLGAISAISLFVGGVGIMNIMLVSVTERIKEIGLRKAIGARRKDILLQFLIESVLMTFCGGVLGVALGALVAQLISLLAGWSTVVTISSVVMATVFSIGVGLVFGLWPAYQASCLHPIEALRHE